MLKSDDIRLLSQATIAAIYLGTNGLHRYLLLPVPLCKEGFHSFVHKILPVLL